MNVEMLINKKDGSKMLLVEGMGFILHYSCQTLVINFFVFFRIGINIYNNQVLSH